MPKQIDDSKMPAVGKKAPNFTLPTDHGKDVSLSEFKGKKNVVLYFYPKDDTPGCTKQACAFQESSKAIAKSDAVVIGVSPDPAAKHAKFRTKYGLEFILGADTDHKVAEAYGVWAEKSMYGKTYWGNLRATFVINKEGIITKVWPKVSVDGHADEVLEALADI
jgi:peroxiredoxin Q/BCP